MHKVGMKGQVVIDKALRDALGIKPGWRTLQRLVDGRVEITFLPPSEHSLKGRLATLTDVVVPPGEAWIRAREQAWEAMAAEQAARRAGPEAEHTEGGHGPRG